jgi:hypothetical protein
MRLICGMLGLMLLSTLLAGADERPVVQKKQAKVGMSEADILDALGRPPKIARQILFRRHIEQWTYDNPPIRVELDCVRGQPARATSVRFLRLQKN